MKIINKKTLTCGLLVATSFGLMAPANAAIYDNWNDWQHWPSASAAGAPLSPGFVERGQITGEYKVEVDDNTRAILAKYNLPADFYEQAVKTAENGSFEIRVPEGIEFNDELFRSLTPGAENMTAEVPGFDIGGRVIARTPNIAEPQNLQYQELAPGDEYPSVFSGDFPYVAEDGTVAYSMEADYDAFGPGDRITHAYPASSVSSLTPKEGVEAGARFMLYDEYAPTPQREADVLASGNRYLEDGTLSDCATNECVIPVQFAFTGGFLDENGEVVTSDSGDGRGPAPVIQTHMSSDVMMVKVTAVQKRERPASVGVDNAMIFNTEAVDSQAVEKGWVGKVWHSALTHGGSGVFNGSNDVEPFSIKANRDYYTAFTLLTGAGIEDGAYKFNFGTAMASPTQFGVPANFTMDVHAVDTDGQAVEVDGNTSIKNGETLKITGETRNFRVVISHDLADGSDWVVGLDPRNDDLEKTIVLGNGVTANLKVLAYGGNETEISVEIVGGSDNFTLAPGLNLQSSRTGVQDADLTTWAGAIFGGNAIGGVYTTMEVAPGYAINNSETRGVIVTPTPDTPVPEPEPTPEVPEPTPTPEPTPEVPEPTPAPEPTPEPTPTPEVPEPEVPETPEPEVPVVPEPEVPEVPSEPTPEVPVTTDSGVATGETPTMSGASLLLPFVALGGAITAGSVWLRRKFARS